MLIVVEASTCISDTSVYAIASLTRSYSDMAFQNTVMNVIEQCDGLVFMLSFLLLVENYLAFSEWSNW